MVNGHDPVDPPQPWTRGQLAGLLAIGALTWAVIGLLGDHMLSASYTREAEAAADAFAFALLQRTGIGTEGLAAFRERAKTNNY